MQSTHGPKDTEARQHTSEPTINDAQLCPETDTLYVRLPPGKDISTAADMFGVYGDIAHMAAVPGATFNVVVVYFDVRSAMALRMALGSRWCEPGPPMACREVRVPEGAQLAREYMEDVMDVTVDPEDGRSYIVKYFDSRNAEQMQEFVDSVAGLAEEPECDPYAHSLYTPDSDGHVDVLLSGLSESLCTGPCLQAIFGQAGLEGSIVRCQLHRGGRDGTKLVVTFAGCQAAEQCISHFDGRSWGSFGGVPVTACLYPEVHRVDYDGTKERRRHGMLDSVLSDESTTDGASDGSDHEGWACDSAKPRSDTGKRILSLEKLVQV